MFRFNCDCDRCLRARALLADLLIIIFALVAVGLVAAEIGIRN